MNKTFLALPKSLSTKIFLLLIVTMVCIGALFNIVLISIQKKTYTSSHDAHGATLIRLLAHSISLAVVTENKDEMYASVSGLLQQDDVFEVVIWNKDGEMLLQKTKNPAKRLRIIGNPMKMLMIFRQHDKSDYQSMETKDSFILWGQIFFNATPSQEEDWYFEEEEKSSAQEVVGYAAIVLSKKFFKKGVRNIFIQTGVSVLIFLFVILLTTFLVIQNVMEPLQKLVLTIRMREGKTEHPSDLKMLTETYTSMVDDLEKSFQTISELNEGLEEKVKYRTLQLTEANDELHQRQEKLKNSNTHLSEALRQLKETQEQLIQKEKLAAMGQLVAGVAHELNNTVNFISGALPSLHRSFDEMKEILTRYEEVEKARGSNILDEKFEEVRAIKEKLSYEELFITIDQLMENMEEGTTRTTGIIRDLKIFSREDVEKMTPLDLHTVINSTINYVDKQLLKNITIRRDYGPLPLVHCLPGRIGQVFLNIINNSIQAMDGDGQLTIKTEQRNEHVHIHFSDTGCGIHAHDMAKIFDPFFTNKEIGKGTGLGLGISYSIIRQHGGDIKVQSDVGNGSVFEIILPVTPGETF
ncbi:MAG: ATP-binding protein [Candidatus Electrothrix sp. GW3-4]|uniref:sensor histidine kinase n=1 Tax=Candidatus Electrothrix sp. GW3-4 TaxID=3126740 RepID=UPI0030CFC6E4